MKTMLSILKGKSILFLLTFLTLNIFSESVYAIQVKPLSKVGVSYRKKEQLRNPKKPCPTPLPQPMKLNDGDVICTDKNSVVKLICDDKSETYIGSRQEQPVNSKCPKNASRQLIDPEKILEGGINEQIPYIISPRYTRLLSHCPSFRWHGIPTAISYTVTLYKFPSGQKREVWSVLKTATGAAVEKLTEDMICRQNGIISGTDYQLVVVANLKDGSKVSSELEEKEVAISEYKSDAKGVRGLRFRLYNPKEINEITEIAEVIKGSLETREQKVINFLVPLYVGSKLYVENNLYIQTNLHAEAVEAVEKLIEDGSQEPVTYRTLAELYAQIGLARLAKSAYQQALAKATLRSDLQEKELAQKGLDQLCKKLRGKLPGCAN